ncbi:uncharacterized protein LOC131241233 [Magnolia sinica]|uniref:uncharacterized protein LOC131241233 n=1 Tax=Magnolia sinica TaxID=86752 RepID=UPI00265966AF|nr:uncharacterized protein LOC131241233 [Magnolia sinica]XP_058095953.1 uncharacterized protein LOC131241233 [Magnolia sinica]XP_058095954.1 uncharacterized protein LOC131241233 [Magnolia sinica]
MLCLRRMASWLKGKLERDLQMVAVPQEPPTKTSALPPLLLTSTPAAGAESNALVEYKKGTGLKEDDEDLEVKLRRIIDHVPVRVSNTSSSSTGSGSGDFHQIHLV